MLGIEGGRELGIEGGRESGRGAGRGAGRDTGGSTRMEGRDPELEEEKSIGIRILRDCNNDDEVDCNEESKP